MSAIVTALTWPSSTPSAAVELLLRIQDGHRIVSDGSGIVIGSVSRSLVYAAVQGEQAALVDDETVVVVDVEDVEMVDVIEDVVAGDSTDLIPYRVQIPLV